MIETAAPTIWPALRYADAPAAIRFLVEAFGFDQTLVVPGEGGREIAHAELRWPEGGGVMLGSTSENSVFGRLKPGMTSIYVVTDTPDALFERATAAGAEVVRGLHDEDYGCGGSPFATRRAPCGPSAPTAEPDAWRVVTCARRSTSPSPGMISDNVRLRQAKQSWLNPPITSYLPF